MTTIEVNKLIEDNLHIAKAMAVKYWNGGECHDELEEVHSQALLALTEAAHSFDPTKSPQGVPGFAPWVSQRIRWKLMNNDDYDKRHCPDTDSLDHLIDEDRTVAEVTPDSSQDSPSETLEIQERYQNVNQISEVTVRAPDNTGEWVARLRMACFNALSEQDMTDVMKAVVTKAKKGDTQATKLLLDYFCGGVGTAPKQTVIVQQKSS